MAGPELPVIQKTYDLVLWSCHHLVKFPRTHRFTLGDRLERNLYDILDALIEAKFRKDRRETLVRVNRHLEVLRFQFRLSHDLRCLNTDSYGFAAKSVNEIGQMVGGWLKVGPAAPAVG